MRHQGECVNVKESFDGGAGQGRHLDRWGRILPSWWTATTSWQVIGVGGGGSNAVDRMAKQDITGVEFW